jgi:hypothetical protein
LAGYNAEARAQDHLAAWAQLRAVQVAWPESDRHGKRGAYYVAFGEPARECAKASIASFKEFNPGIEVAVVAATPLGCEDIFIQHADEDIGARAVKVQIYDLAPRDWQYILYLDADTQVIANLGFLYQCVLDGWDMVICKNPMKYHLAREMMRSDNRDEVEPTLAGLGCSELIQLNGGVFCFQRNPRTSNFFHAWYDEWTRWGKRDQAALLRALHAHPLKMYVLGNEWNTMVKNTPSGDEYEPGRANSAGILHFPLTARRWRGKVAERSDSPEAWARVQEWERQNRK